MQTIKGCKMFCRQNFQVEPLCEGPGTLKKHTLETTVDIGHEFTVKLLGGPGPDRLMNLGSIPYCESMFSRLVEECEARFD